MTNPSTGAQQLPGAVVQPRRAVRRARRERQTGRHVALLPRTVPPRVRTELHERRSADAIDRSELDELLALRRRRQNTTVGCLAYHQPGGRRRRSCCACRSCRIRGCAGSRSARRRCNSCRSSRPRTARRLRQNRRRRSAPARGADEPRDEQRLRGAAEPVRLEQDQRRDRAVRRVGDVG